MISIYNDNSYCLVKNIFDEFIRLEMEFEEENLLSASEIKGNYLKMKKLDIFVNKNVKNLNILFNSTQKSHNYTNNVKVFMTDLRKWVCDRRLIYGFFLNNFKSGKTSFGSNCNLTFSLFEKKIT